jgi:hypothetical protein
MDLCMNGDTRLTAIFEALSPENQAHLLTCARLSRIAENAVKKMMVTGGNPAVGSKHGTIDRQEGKPVYMPFLFNKETK